MARGIVTRTVTGIEAQVKIVDTTTEQIVEKSVILNKTKKLSDETELKKAIAKALPEGEVLVNVVSTQEINKCYGVPVNDFMAMAKELDPKTRAVLETEEAEEN